MNPREPRLVNTVSDQQLVAATLAGDRNAFAKLVDRYAAAVRTVAFHIVRDHHASEDIAQETFVAAYKRLANLRVPSLFGRWILKIARHQAVRLIRSSRPDVSLDHAADVATSPPTETDTDHLLAEVMRLPEREQRLLMLRYFNGHSVEEIARITNRPVGTVTKQLSRGYARLRERLTEVLV
jgi:RNA polymerase sigma-70 factor (ECF subfamily)